MKLLAAALLLALARTAHATGPCENTETRYDPPELFDETTQSFAIPATQPWCDEVTDGGTVSESRGTVTFVELRDTHDKVIGRLSTAVGDDAKHLGERVGSVEAIPYGKLHATLLARGYKPLVSKLKDCTLMTTWVDVQPGGGWRAAALQLDVVRGKKQLLRLRLGEGSIARRGDQLVRVHVLPKQATIVLFAIVPSCAGPPPGYFGPDDGGDCYHVDTPKVVTIDARPTPPLAACF